MENAATKQRAQTVYSLRNFSVLLVDDYEFMQGLIATMLKAFGVGNIMICDDGAQAQDLLQITQARSKNLNIKPVDMILVDWMMPNGSGLDLIHWVRNHKSDLIRFTPIILVSAFTSENVVVAARDSGANEALVKPVSGEKMAARILSVIDHPRPYVKAPTFFGPDRRRRDKEWKGEERRVMDTNEIQTHNERL